jgi:hypothetical protein
MAAPAGPKPSDKCESISPISWPIRLRTLFYAVLDAFGHLLDDADLTNAQRDAARAFMKEYTIKRLVNTIPNAPFLYNSTHIKALKDADGGPDGDSQSKVIDFIWDTIKPLADGVVGTWCGAPPVCPSCGSALWCYHFVQLLLAMVCRRVVTRHHLRLTSSKIFA